MSDFEEPMPEDDQPNEEEVARLTAKGEELSEAARKIGLYTDHMTAIQIETHEGPKLALVADFLIGDVAFTDRIQDPEQDKFNKDFQDMTTNMTNDEFLDVRARMKRNMAAGRDALDDGGE